MGGDNMDTSRIHLVGGGAPARLPQYLAAISATLGAFSLGCGLGYSSPAGSQLTNNQTINSTLHLTKIENSWFSSSLTLGALVGGLVGGALINTLGRRKTVLFISPWFAASWALIGFATNVPMLIVGRVITGLFGGICSIAVPTYISEFASPDIRGVLGSGFQLMVTVGILYAYTMGMVLNWRWLCLPCAVIPIIQLIAMLFNHESPMYLLAHGKRSEAVKALRYFRGSEYDIEEELVSMERSVRESKSTKLSIASLTTSQFKKAAATSFILFFFQQFSGVTALLFNLSTIFQSAHADMSDSLSSVIVGLVQVVGTLLGAVLMDRAGRRILLIISVSLMCVTLGVMGLFYYLLDTNPSSVANVHWLPLLALIVYIFFFSIGFGPIPWLIVGEVFAPNVREFAGSCAASSNWALAFITTFIFEPLEGVMHDYGVYWFFCGMCVLALFFCIFFVVETKGKTLDEIQQLFGAPPRRRNDDDSSIYDNDSINSNASAQYNATPVTNYDAI